MSSQPVSEDNLRRYVAEFGPDIFSTDGESLKCELCCKIIVLKKKSHVTQHVRSVGHTRKLQLREGNAEEIDRGLENHVELSSRESDYSMALCRMLVRTNIPLWKLRHPDFRSFMQTYHQQEMPDHTTLRKTYLKKLYMDTILKTRQSIGESRIWVSIDETTDVKGQYVVNTVIGCLKAGEPSTPFLLNSEIVEATNHSSIAQAFTTALHQLWPDGIHHERVLLFLSDAASYMKKAGEGLKVLFPKMIHLTCIVHGIHRVCEQIRILSPKVDSLIANVKKIFRKAPSRIQTFRSVAPGLALPPDPIVTRWGTWISAAVYYANHFEEVQSVVQQLDASDAAAIGKAQQLMSDSALKSNLAFVASNFSELPEYMEKLECSALSLNSSIEIIESVRRSIQHVGGPKAAPIKEKFQRVLQQNPGLEAIVQIQQSLSGGNFSAEALQLSIADVSSFTHAPLASVDVERSFSRYKLLLSDRRQSLTPENAKYHLIPMCYSSGIDRN